MACKWWTWDSNWGTLGIIIGFQVDKKKEEKGEEKEERWRGRGFIN